MSSGTGAARGTEWLLEEWATRFAAGFEAMAGETPAHKTVAPPVAFASPFVWRQPFDVADGAAVEITIPAAGWRTVGKQILAAAGIDDAPDEDCQPTYLEVLQQSHVGSGQRGSGCGRPRSGLRQRQ